jgi:hypothetical protein
MPPSETDMERSLEMCTMVTIKAADAKRYAGQIVLNEEEEIFFPSLTVRQTMDFAT